MPSDLRTALKDMLLLVSELAIYAPDEAIEKADYIKRQRRALSIYEKEEETPNAQEILPF